MGDMLPNWTRHAATPFPERAPGGMSCEHARTFFEQLAGQRSSLDGDTLLALRGHLAICSPCTEEFTRIRLGLPRTE